MYILASLLIHNFKAQENIIKSSIFKFIVKKLNFCKFITQFLSFLFI